MFMYPNPYDFEPRVAEGDQVNGMGIDLDVVDGFDGQDVDSEGCRFLSPQSNTSQGYP